MSDRDKQNSQELWGGRFSEPTDAFVQRFTASQAFDRRLAVYDIAGSRAHADMLASTGVLTADENAAIQQGLQDVLAEIEADRFIWSIALEDVHMNIEARLTELIGDVGKKLHTGRSRNDQVATDLRLYLRAELDHCRAELTRLQLGIVTLAAQHAETVMPGFTHLQVAQPVTLGHHLMAW
ncbi:MAG: argininosuccinate lyase, partial [Luminiphilus sp.]|nr:argininosuccinate lyase [Luminiphilus sp.]